MRTLLLSVVVVAVSLGVLEGLVRSAGIARHLYTEPAFVGSRDGTSWRYRPGFAGSVLGPTEVHIGPLGSRLAAEERLEGFPRVVIFGDSVTFGQGVTAGETFSAKLEARLRGEWPAVEVLNFGVQGHSIAMEVEHVADRFHVTQPTVVVLAFGSDDLNPARAQSRVDLSGYLTKKTFGPPTASGDWLRAMLRESHLALASKDAYLRWQARRAPSVFGDGPGKDYGRELAVFREAMSRFDTLTRGRGRLVACLDLRDTPLARALEATMAAEFPHLAYVHGPPFLEGKSLATLRVPRDGHPNARAHTLYADMLEVQLRRVVRESQTPQVAPG
jgi:lysophospholipase L1-like esterase